MLDVVVVRLNSSNLVYYLSPNCMEFAKNDLVVVFGNLNDAIKFKKNNEDDLDVESHNKAFISHQYDDNDSIRGKNSIIEQHQQITQMQKGSNRSGSGVGKKKSKKSEKKINSKRSGNENEEKNGKDNINVNISASNMSKHIRNSLDSNVINDINNNLIGSSSIMRKIRERSIYGKNKTKKKSQSRIL